MGTISFEKVTADHLAELAAILNYYIEHTTVTFHTGKLTAEDMSDKIFFGNPRFQSFIIKQDGGVIGYCAVSPWKKQEAYDSTGEINIYLHPESVGKGIGSTAIQYLLKFARENDINNLIAGICSENIPSIKLFEKSGFQQCAHFQKVGKKFGRVLDTVYLQVIFQAD